MNYDMGLRLHTLGPAVGGSGATGISLGLFSMEGTDGNDGGPPTECKKGVDWDNPSCLLLPRGLKI